MACPMAPSAGFFRNYLNWFVTSIAWLLADWFGWRVALSVYPPLLRNKVAIVTGANAGLGLETTKALLQQGATVIMACRSMQAAATARQDILADARNAGPVPDAAGRLIPLQVDFEDFDTIPKFVEAFHATGLPLHLLVNNAGIHLKPYKKVSCGFERTIASNFFGHFWLTQLLLDDLKAAAPARIVEMSSFVENFGLLGIYTRRLPWHDLRGASLRDSGERPYTLSKLYILMAARELARRLEGSGVDVLTVHPGFADSTWYLKSDEDAYFFSWVVSRVRSVIPWLGVGQPCTTGLMAAATARSAREALLLL
ncbi:NAD(P)-binding protein [Scenedesmus sp. NREL 46B-D3]|nr:NAD(P)-binding protein [Scenedesmus sp. NREL 46B-D3]